MTDPNTPPTKVLLLHGPLDSNGINPLTQRMSGDSEGRFKLRATFDCRQTILTMSVVFRSLGWKIAYSGWADDTEWLEANRELFDYLVISDQSKLRSKSEFRGVMIDNNKEKLYFGSLRGVQLIKEQVGSNALVFRLRSDISLNYKDALADMARVKMGSGLLLVEYLNTTQAYWMPDFMVMGEVDMLVAIYEHLYQNSVAGTSYHISSHIDHCLAYLRMTELGPVKAMQCMSRVLYDSVVWRGIPRYLEEIFDGYAQGFFFDGEVVMNSQVRVADLVARLAANPD